MGRIVGPAIRGASGWIRSFAKAWCEFWFAPADPALLGLVRILAGAMLVYTHAVWGLALDDFFSPDGWLSAEAVRALQRMTNQYAMSYWWWVPRDWMWPAHLAALAVLVMFMLGLFTRLTSILAYVITVSYVQRVPSALFGLDQINAMLALYLAIGYLALPARDRSLALDRRIARMRQARRNLRSKRGIAAEFPDARPSVSANLAIRLIQVHMCVIYFFAGIAKLQGPAWWGGDAMWLAFANLEYQSIDMTWLANHPWLVNAMTHFTVMWEISFSALIWSPRWRPLVLAGAVVLHLGIGAFLGMWTFGLVMLIGCSSFLPPVFARWVAGLSSGGNASANTSTPHNVGVSPETQHPVSPLAEATPSQPSMQPSAFGTGRTSRS